MLLGNFRERVHISHKKQGLLKKDKAPQYFVRILQSVNYNVFHFFLCHFRSMMDLIPLAGHFMISQLTGIVITGPVLSLHLVETKSSYILRLDPVISNAILVSK